MQMHAARRIDAAHGAHERRIAINQRRRQQVALQQGLIAVDIVDNGIQQLGALDQAGFQGLPFLGPDQEGDRVHAPGAGRFPGVVVDVVRGAVFPDEALRRVPAVLQFLIGKPPQAFQEVAPVRAHARLGIHHLVIDAGERGIVVGQENAWRRAVLCRIVAAHAMLHARPGPYPYSRGEDRRSPRPPLVRCLLKMNPVGKGVTLAQCTVFARRRSRVMGNSSLSRRFGASDGPVVWPMSSNRARRRLSAS